MATLEALLVQETDLRNTKAQLYLQMQEVDDSLARIRIRIAEARFGINRNALTYNLPDEILSAIFEAGQSQPPIYRRNSSDTRWSVDRPFELVISSVSQRWRNIALDTPQLWTNLVINICQSTRDLLDLYLYRSKICLLDIVFKDVEPLGHYTMSINRNAVIESNFIQYLDWLVPHVARWRRFAIWSFYVGSFPTELSRLTHLHAPVLETLVIRCIGNQAQLVEVFSEGAPLLSSFETSGAFIQPPQAAIRSLQLGRQFHLSQTEFSQFVLPMSSLTHISMYSTVIANATNHPTIVLPFVRSLDIHLVTASVGPLQFLDLPAVETLTVHGFTHEVIVAFTQLHHPYPVVQSLKIVSRHHFNVADTPAATTLDLISLFPNVQDIAFHSADPSPFLHALQNPQLRDELLWPRLSAITAIVAPGAKAPFRKQTWTYITKVVENRLQLGHPILWIQLSSQILECGSKRQQQWLRGQAALITC